MIELPAGVVPNSAEPALVDRGGVMRGASALRVNRKGSHYRIACTLPPLLPEVGRVVVSRLIKAVSEGLRVPYPLMHAQAGGLCAVNGANQQGRLLAIRGAPPGLVIGEGWWITIAGADDRRYLHNVTQQQTIPENGAAQLALYPELKVPFIDNATVFLSDPMIEGPVDEGTIWSYSLAHHTMIGFTIEEAR